MRVPPMGGGGGGGGVGGGGGMSRRRSVRSRVQRPSQRSADSKVNWQNQWYSCFKRFN